jgi:release factor glutamine methyltransferase
MRTSSVEGVMRALLNSSYEQLVHSNAEACGLGRWQAPPGRLRRAFRSTVHYLSHKFILDRRSTRSVRAGGFRLTIYPSVFHPKLFLTSEFFARFLATIDLQGKNVADVGTGSGILALAAARAGANVVALDINPMAVNAAADNARSNGLGDRVTALRSDLMSAVGPSSQFDVIISNPPFFSGEPRDMADRAWVAGPGYRDIASLFEQARQRLKPSGTMYVLLSSDSDLHFFGLLIAKAGFRARTATAFSILVESMIIYELTPLKLSGATSSNLGSAADKFEDREIRNFGSRKNARVDENRVRA